MPTRLIFIGASDFQLRLDASPPPGVRYAALSHRWGESTSLCTLKSNIDDHCRHLPFEKLRRNFQDAIRVTRALGLLYLWIDSLCIIQGDEEDWKHEAARMGIVFSNAYFTIAASFEVSPGHGFLTRNGQVPLIAALPGPGNIRLFISESLENFHRDVENAPLNTRGWVFQERALSRRTLHFTRTQVYWECGCGVTSERLIKLDNPEAALLGDSDFPRRILHFYKDGRQRHFQILFKQYSALDLSHHTDRSVAVSSLEQRLAEAFKTRRAFGVFELYFQRSLLWQRRHASFLKRVNYPHDQRVPSWSWMAYRGPIDYMDVPFDSVDWCFDSDQLFSAASGPLSIRPKTSMTVSSRELVLGRQQSVDRIRFDEHESPPELSLRCVVLGKDMAADKHGERTHYALVIAEDPSRAKMWRRVGAAWLLGGHLGIEEERVMLH